MKLVTAGLKSEIKKNKVDVWIIDPFVRSHIVAENDNGKISAVCQEYSDIADTTNSAGILRLLKGTCQRSPLRFAHPLLSTSRTQRARVDDLRSRAEFSSGRTTDPKGQPAEAMAGPLR